MKEYQDNKGLWQAVENLQIESAIACVNGDLQLFTVNDYYRGRKITKVSFERNLPILVEEYLGTKQAVLFHLEGDMPNSVENNT